MGTSKKKCGIALRSEGGTAVSGTRISHDMVVAQIL